MLGAIEGIPVIVSEHLRLADVDGKVTDAGNDTNTGRVLLFNRTQWAQASAGSSTSTWTGTCRSARRW